MITGRRAAPTTSPSARPGERAGDLHAARQTSGTPAPGSDDGRTLTLANANLLTVVQTVTDADADADTGGDLKGTRRVQIEDDGPDALWPMRFAGRALRGRDASGSGSEEGRRAAAGGLGDGCGDDRLRTTSYVTPCCMMGSHGAGTSYRLVRWTGPNTGVGFDARRQLWAGALIVLNQSGNMITGRPAAPTASPSA